MLTFYFAGDFSQVKKNILLLLASLRVITRSDIPDV